MREYKFRGMTVQREWVYGNLSILPKDFLITVAGYYISNKAGAPFAYAVRPETVGQYTGLKDRNGKDVYEGDVMASVTYGGETMVVRWDSHGGFYLHSKNDNDDDHLNTEEIEMSEVLGNVFTHPHLLEQGEKE